ncbi:MAG: hypothetical protein MK130_06305 [Puniceicoccaceae bacterium]|nr:hypothetical protein [Puniceicoccaceae bacterium]
MSFLKKIFGKKQKVEASDHSNQKAKTGSQPLEPKDDELIKVYDKYGREMQITRQEWLDNVLTGNLKKHWDSPDELYQLLLSAFNDGFFAEVEDAARHLSEIDPTPERGVVVYAIVFLQTHRPAKAESLLSEHIERNGEDGTVLTNLAKAQSALGREHESLQTLWHALELDPNQDNAVGWYEVTFREKDGDAAGLAALERIAALPGSWRPQLWIARAKLQARQLDVAMKLYNECLNRATKPLPTDLLMQLSGDLGNNGHLLQITELVTPHFAPEIHGLQVGNNLIKANIDLGQLDQASSILRQLQLQQRPDWKEHLAYWENEIAKIRSETAESPASVQDMKITLLSLEGPLWLKDDHPLTELFPPKSPDAPRIAFTGCSAEVPNIGTEIVQQNSDNPGRFSRALPLFLSEQISLGSNTQGITQIPWSTLGAGSFVLSGVASDDKAIAEYARMTAQAIPNQQAPSFAVNSHIIAIGENWSLHIQIIRTIDASCINQFRYNFPECGFHKVAEQVLQDIRSVLTEEADYESMPNSAACPSKGRELDHYLLRLEQCLAVRCSSMNSQEKGFLSNPAEIIDGSIQFCLQNASHIPGRLLLRHTLDGMLKIDPDLVASASGKIFSLTKDHPLEVQVDRYLEGILKK